MANVVNLTDTVSESIRNSGNRVFEAVVEKLVTDEVEYRKSLLLAALVKRQELTKKLEGVKPKPQFFNAEGKPVGEPVFTPQQNDERRKTADALTSLETAINTALGDGCNFEPLKKIVGNSKDSSD